jgi:hypothetical protein
MMETVLNLGVTADGEWFADVADRFREMYAEVVGCKPPGAAADFWQRCR